MFLEQLSFPSLVFTVRLCFGVKYVSRATTYCVIVVVEKWQQKIITDLDCLGRVTLQIFVFVILKLLLQAAPRTNFLFKISNYIQNICRVGKELKENYLTLHSIFHCINEWSVEFTKVVYIENLIEWIVEVIPIDCFQNSGPILGTLFKNL